MKRVFDLVLALMAGLVLIVPCVVIAVVVRFTSPGPALHWSRRVGQENRPFLMPKFRSMYTDAPQVATHLLGDPHHWVTPVGRFLRRSSLDELPQVLSILKGDMSFVGPRPALFNQNDLVALRTAHGVHMLPPGLTGWAQINGRDELAIPDKVALDAWYLKHHSLVLDVKILALTLGKVFAGRGVSH